MSRNRKYRYFVGDFETTVFEGQKYTEVWASALVELKSEEVEILSSIEETIDYLKNLKSNVIVYYHNLKFDGTFIVSYFLEKLNLKQSIIKTGSDDYDIQFTSTSNMSNNSFIYNISDKGKWFTIIAKFNNYMIEFRDSLKLLPFSVKEIGKAFKTKHTKLDIEYTGFRYAGCTITDKEKEYISNDVLVVKEALENMFAEGHNKITIGACCLSEYKSILTKKTFESLYPDLTLEYLNQEEHTYDTVDAWIRKSYKGGWCYLVRGKENKIYTNGVTADVNSLYPSMMHSESGNIYPVGYPTWWSGNYIPDEATNDGKYFFIRLKTRFYIKEGMLPFVQIKGNFLYSPTEVLETSDVYIKKENRYSRYITDFEGNLVDTRVEMVLTQTEYYLLIDHYNLEECVILDGCYFNAYSGLFDEYIDKYKKIKMESTGARRTLAKLFLNNLYGKMASNTDSSFKFCELRYDNSLGYVGISESNKKPGYIPVGTAITGYARNFTIRHAQLNYHGKDKPGFIYADTDSIHCDTSKEKLIGIKLHDTDFNHWSIESEWDTAIFARQKTYIEHTTQYGYDIKCAGMPDRCKKLFEYTLHGLSYDDLTEEQRSIIKTHEQRDFLKNKHTLSDFKIGLNVPGKLMPKRIQGGTILTEGFYQMR